MKKHLRFFLASIMMLTYSMSFAQAYKTLTFPDEGGEKIGAYDKTWTAKIGNDTWIIENFNNNNWNNWTYIRCGRKSDASVASIATDFAIDKAIEKVVVNFSNVKNADKINSVKLLVASDAAYATIVETIDVTAAKGEQSITISSPAANRYYKLVFDCDVAGANGIIEVTSVSYYAKGSVVEEPETPEVPAATGDGTLANPFNCTAANEAALALGSGNTSEAEYYIKGKVASIKNAFSTQYGNVSLYISDDGTSNGQFYVYRALYLENKKWNGEEPNVKEGDEIVVCGKLTNYNGTPETSQKAAYLYSINEKTKADAPAVDISNTPETAYTVQKAAELILAGEGLGSEVYVNGVITEVTEVSTEYGNATFTINDGTEEGATLTAYHMKYLNNEKFTEETAKVLNVGDKVILKGKLMDYQGANQITSGYVYSHTSSSTGINGINAEKKANGKVYNFAGQEVNKNQKGFVIINGKKTIQ